MSSDVNQIKINVSQYFFFLRKIKKTLFSERNLNWCFVFNLPSKLFSVLESLLCVFYMTIEIERMKKKILWMNMSWKFLKILNENLIIDFLRTMCDCQGHPKDHSISLSSQNNLFYEISNDFHFTSSNKNFFFSSRF